jgi:hypothetical protein
VVVLSALRTQIDRVGQTPRIVDQSSTELGGERNYRVVASGGDDDDVCGRSLHRDGLQALTQE